jgi:hypothetical protein
MSTIASSPDDQRTEYKIDHRRREGKTERKLQRMQHAPAADDVDELAKRKLRGLEEKRRERNQHDQ